MAKQKHDKEFEDEFNKSIAVSSYLDQVFDKITTGKDIDKNIVPNYNEGKSQVGASNETSSLYSLDMDSMVSAVGPGAVSTLMTPTAINAPKTANSKAPAESTKPAFKMSKNQYNAMQKYPALIEFLGTDESAPLVTEIAEKVHHFMVHKIEANTKAACKYAQVCVADRKNIKQYFADEEKTWVCLATARGPFRGDEAFYYSPEKDSVHILRKVDGGYVEVTTEFNVIHELGETSE